MLLCHLDIFHFYIARTVIVIIALKMQFDIKSSKDEDRKSVV